MVPSLQWKRRRGWTKSVHMKLMNSKLCNKCLSNFFHCCSRNLSWRFMCANYFCARLVWDLTFPRQPPFGFIRQSNSTVFLSFTFQPIVSTVFFLIKTRDPHSKQLKAYLFFIILIDNLRPKIDNTIYHTDFSWDSTAYLCMCIM